MTLCFTLTWDSGRLHPRRPRGSLPRTFYRPDWLPLGLRGWGTFYLPRNSGWDINGTHVFRALQWKIPRNKWDFENVVRLPVQNFPDQFQAIRGDICVTILNFDDERMKEHITRSSLDGPLHGGFSKFLVNGKRPIRHAMVGDKALWWHECVQPPPPLRKNRPLAAQLKSTFGHSCYNYNFGFRSSLQKSDHPG